MAQQHSDRFAWVVGEIKNTVMMAYSNKAHDGYLGDSVVGEWCNFGAGSTNSNLKNTAGEIKIWDFASKEYVPVGNKCGVIMGDYSRVAVNSAINTGSMIGVSCNVLVKAFYLLLLRISAGDNKAKEATNLIKPLSRSTTGRK